MQIGIIAYEQSRHDGRDGVWGVVLGVLAATSRVVVLDEVFENGGEEIIVLAERLLEREVNELVHEGACERGALCLVGDVNREPLEQRDPRLLGGLRREDIDVFVGDIDHGCVEDEIEVALRLVVPERRDEVFGLEAGNVGRQFVKQVEPVVLAHGGV